MIVHASGSGTPPPPAVEVPDDLVAISNAAEVEREDLGDGTVRVRFAETMVMSTYLVAFVVGPLEVTEAVDVDGVPLRIVTPPGKGDLTDYALDVGLADIEARVTALAADLRARLGAHHGVGVHDRGARRCGIVTFTIDGWDAADVSQALRERQINTSVTAVTGARWDLADRGLDRMVRASVHYYNTDQELDRLVDAVADLSVSGAR